MEGVAEGVGVSLVVGRHVRVLLLIFDCVGGVLLVEVECGCGWEGVAEGVVQGVPGGA